MFVASSFIPPLPLPKVECYSIGMGSVESETPQMSDVYERYFLPSLNSFPVWSLDLPGPEVTAEGESELLCESSLTVRVNREGPGRL